MAHELSIRKDGKVEMAFMGETPWHKLGQRVTQGASIGVWKKEAGLDWIAEEDTPHTGDINRGTEIFFDDYKALYRSDSHEPLAIVGAGYNVVQPGEVLEFFRDMTELGGWHIHTAGALRGGRKIWAMASNKKSHFVGKRNKRTGVDEIIENLLFATSLDGSMKSIVQPTPVCVVCANTLAAALHDESKQIRISHRTVFDPAAVKKTLGLSQDAFLLFMDQANKLAEQAMPLGLATEILNAIFAPKPKADDKKITDLSWMGDLSKLGQQPETQEGQEASRSVSAILDLFEGDGMGAQLGTREGTAWGLLNAVTEHVDHSMGRSDDTRMDSAWFGRGNSFKSQALDAIVEAVL